MHTPVAQHNSSSPLLSHTYLQRSLRILHAPACPIVIPSPHPWVKEATGHTWSVHPCPTAKRIPQRCWPQLAAVPIGVTTSRRLQASCRSYRGLAGAAGETAAAAAAASFVRTPTGPTLLLRWRQQGVWLLLRLLKGGGWRWGRRVG